jgi:hypothetical protein
MRTAYARMLSVVMMAFCAVVVVVHQANAATEKDIQLLSKAVGFAEGGLGKDVAVLFDAGNPASVSEADQVVGLLSGAGLTGSKVAVSGAGGAAAKVLYVTTGLNGSWDAVASAAASGKKLTATMDDACVKAGKCVLGVQSTPAVEIKVSKAASAAAGVSFGAAFKMMIKEY